MHYIKVSGQKKQTRDIDMECVVAFNMGETSDAAPLCHFRVIYKVWGLEEVKWRGREQRGSFLILQSAGRWLVVVRAGCIVRHERIHHGCLSWNPKVRNWVSGCKSCSRFGSSRYKGH